MTKKVINKCQYWNTNEPPVCKHWDVSNTVCIYAFSLDDDEEKRAAAQYAPYCNLLGTKVLCQQYESVDDSSQSRCILPDPARHVCNRFTGKKWVTSTETKSDATETSYEIKAWSFDDINGYNDGQCDGFGTSTTCSGYSPYHMGFGVLEPSTGGDYYSKISDLGQKLPINFVIYNIRAELSRCFWWKGDDPGIFTVNTDGKVELISDWSCSFGDATRKYSEFTLDDGPPCNGCKPECPHYTGVCWKYCVDEKMETGDPVLAEQIHELRYYHREATWTVDAIESIFIDEGVIFAWGGKRTITEHALSTEEESKFLSTSTLKGDISTVIGPDNTIQSYEIPAVVTKMTSFDKLTIDTKNEVMTEGTSLIKKVKDFPTLIRHIQSLPLFPIIKNRFSLPRNSPQPDLGYFEVPNLLSSDSLLVYGKSFYNAPTKAINLSDKDVHDLIPWIVYELENIGEIEGYIDASNLNNFSEFMLSFKAALAAIETLMPDKIKSNSLPDDELTFIIDTPLLGPSNTFDSSNENTILVWQEVDGEIAFSKVRFIKRVVGGMLIQTTYELLGDNKPTKTPNDYEYGSNANVNENGTISFKYLPFISEGIASEVSHLYNDSILQNPVTEVFFKGFKQYKYVAEKYFLEDNQIVLLGSSSHMLLDLDHPGLNNLFKPFEFDKILIEYTVENPDEDTEEKTITKECEMEAVHHGSEGLIGPQQLIIKAKDIKDFSAFCLDSAVVVIENLTFWDRRSYGDDPKDYDFFKREEESGDYFTTLDVGDCKKIGSDAVNVTFDIFNFGDAMTPSIVITNCEGKPFTLYKTKTIHSVKQPECPDVEIFYNWKADYIKYQNSPVCTCCGPWKEINPVPTTKQWMPYCGDHFQNALQKKGPMWWPYNACLEWDTYEQLTNLNNFSVDVIGLYQLKTKDAETGKAAWVHGSHDMRMQGPHRFYGDVGLGCNPLRPCSCHMRSYNYHKKGDNVFTGYAKIRGGIPTSQLEVWQQLNCVMPKFGNAPRPLLRTYRSLDHIPYLNSTGTDTLWRLMPATMMFNKADITDTDDRMWDWKCSSAGNDVVNPLGFFLARDFDNVTINETTDKKSRFRHGEVFRCKATIDIAYQHSVGKYSRDMGEETLIPWYEFKQYPLGDSNEFIQWAWQEKWKDLERFPNKKEVLEAFMDSYITNGGKHYAKGPFIGPTLPLTGTFLMLDISYPSYLYDYRLKEFRQVAEEGDYLIRFIAPEKNPYTGEYEDYPYFELVYSDAYGSQPGPKRYIDWEGEWRPDPVYDDCIGDANKYRKTINNQINEFVWSDEVTLFDHTYTPMADTAAEDKDQDCQTYYLEDGIPPKTIKLHTLFHRGLNVTINKDKFGGALPLRTELVHQVKNYNLFGEDTGFKAVCMKDDTTSNKVPLGFFFDGKKKTIGKIEISYKFGAELLSPKTDESDAVYAYHHKPQVIIYASEDGETAGKELYRTKHFDIFDGDNNAYEIKTEEVSWENELSYIGDGSFGVVIEFRVYPDELELSKVDETIQNRFLSNSNFVSIVSTRSYEEILVDGVEPLKLHERKYYVSYGQSGDCPPQGRDDDENARVLNRRPGHERSCVWQIDTTGSKIEVKGVPDSSGHMKFMNKVRGRIVFEGYEDGTVTTNGKSIKAMESKQKELYDLAVNASSASSIMTGILPTAVSDVLKDAGVMVAGIPNLLLKNTTTAQLAELNNFPQMSGEGHRYQPASPKKEDCGSDAKVCIDSGRAGDSFLFEYTNLDALLDEHVLVNAVLFNADPSAGKVGITTDATNLKLARSSDFRNDTADKYGTTGENIYGNPFDTIMTNPIVQLYSGASWQIERTMMYEALLDTVFPRLFDRSPSPNIYADKYSVLVYLAISPMSYGGDYNDSYYPSPGYSKQPANLNWPSKDLWPGFGDNFRITSIFGF